MDEDRILGEDLPLPPARLFERLAQIPGYSWDQTIEPIHSSYDHWHVTGVKYSADSETASTQTTTTASSSRSKTSHSAQHSPSLESRSFFRNPSRPGFSEASSDVASRDEVERIWLPVLARVSTHVVRLEREFHLLRSIIDISDPECKHTVHPIDIIRLTPQPGDQMPLLVTLYEYPGPNYLKQLISFGPAFFQANGQQPQPGLGESDLIEQVPLSTFLDFAIGACECLELLHYGLKTIHGEIRADAFHFNPETGAVRLSNTGNGARSFDNALSDGWSALSRELGVKNKLQFIAPEQTGRLPTEPDSRTDVYALGVLFWSMLVGRPAFDAIDPVEVVQNVLSKKLCPVSSLRLDIPDAASAVIQKMTQKQITERYYTVSSVKWDLQQIVSLLGDADAAALKSFKIAQRDVSSFFTLPCGMFGRKEEFDRVLHVINKVRRRQQAALSQNSSKQSIPSVYAVSTGSSISGERAEIPEAVDGSSDSGSYGTAGVRKNSVGHQLKHVSTQDSMGSTGSKTSNNKALLTPNRIKSPTDSQLSWEHIDRDTTHFTSLTNSASQFDQVPSLGRRKANSKYRHGARCEVITISGTGGLGKSDLIQRLQPEIRKVGYIAAAKLDRSHRAPFDPLLKIMAALLRQTFSERDVSSEYHSSIRAALKPEWKSLHRVLGLPEQLVFPSTNTTERAVQPRVFHPLKGVKEEPEDNLNSFISLSRRQTSFDFCQGPLCDASIRVADIIIDILRIMSFNKTICICLDDVQYVDEESSNLLLDIMKSKVGCVLIVSGRPDEIVSPDMKTIFQAEGPNITKLKLGPLNEDDIVSYVAATMHQRPTSALVPLAAVVQEKSRGNPFYVRMILETCYRKNCVWYSWRDSTWQFDLDRVFSEFMAPGYGECLGTDFVAKRFQEFPSEARSILLWAALLGTSFSFCTIQRLLSGEFLYAMGDEDEEDVTCPRRIKLTQTNADIMTGLQFLLQSYIILPGETDDEFRFASDHYAQAVASMRQCHNQEKMHFIIAQTKMKYSHDDDGGVHAKARHICLAARLVKERVPNRIRYRDVLYQAALSASKSGAKPTALSYYRTCIYLLQDNAWDSDSDAVDIFYDETRELHIQTADMHLSLGQTTEALDTLSVIFKNAHTPACKARAWMLQSRVHSQLGSMCIALDDLFTGLEDLGVKIKIQSTWEECDAAYRDLSAYLHATDLEQLLSRPLSEDRSLIAIGSLMSEAISVCLWLDPLMFLRLAVEMMNIFIYRGAFSQAVYLCTHLSMIAVGRFKDLNLGLKLSSVALSILSQSNEAPVIARGATIHNSFVNHMRAPIASTLPILEGSMEAAYLLGDRYIILLNASAVVSTRLSLGYDLGELEALCNCTTEEINDWESDIRGGVNIMAVRQTARALQGKTFTALAEHVISDDNHDDVKYQAELASRDRTGHILQIYKSTLFIPLYLYGHYERAVDIGTKMVDSMHGLWSLRLATQVYFYVSLSILSLHLENPNRPGLEENFDTVVKYKEEIDYMRRACDANYGMWSLLVEALLCEVKDDSSGAMLAFEDALDHTQLHNWPLEEALAYELQVDFLVRSGAKRAAQSILQRAISSWNRINATGKAKQLSEKHEWLLRMGTISRSNDVGCQTVDSLLGVPRNPVPEVEPEQNIISSNAEDDHKQKWLEQNQGATDGSLDISGVGLDIIDLSTILEFSQVMSSELEVDKLLTKMVGIIMESCSGSEFALVITEFESHGWCVAAAGDHENGAQAFANGLSFSDVEDKMAQQITHYTLRTKEPVLVHNVLEDERFLHVSEAYAARNPRGRSIIALPIVQANNLLGVIHIEGKPNSFTHRNLVLLRLVCNQVGISLANAFLFQEARKVSAANAAMVEAQKRALAQAREAEQKAKIAEAEANRNVKLKEDAAKAKSIFLANISHDLRTPMTGVIGLAELLKGTTLDHKQDVYVESIRVCADTLLTLINDILDFSKLEAGKMKVASVPINLRQTIAEVVRALRYTHRDRALDTVEDFESIDPDLLVMGDPVRLHQIFMNLLSNSYKFTPKGSVTVKAMAVPDISGMVELTCAVSDTGIGISKEQLVRLFTPFQQADDSTARSYGGSGLGLSICKAIIEEVLGGRISLQSEEGVGTTVTFTLAFRRAAPGSIARMPWSQEVIQDKKTLHQHTAKDLTLTPREKIRVCIAEDNPINQKIAVNFVQHLGLSCEVFSDGEQAVEALRQQSKDNNPFHVVLMDVQMPVLDGYDATRKIRADTDSNVNEVLVIAMTASAIKGDRERCIEAGMNNYLAKPVRSDVLRNMLDRYLAPQLKPIQRPKAMGFPRSNKIKSPPLSVLPVRNKTEDTPNNNESNVNRQSLESRRENSPNKSNGSNGVKNDKNEINEAVEGNNKVDQNGQTGLAPSETS